MGIFSLKKEKEKQSLVLVFDIGSSSVGGALFWIKKNKIPEIILAIREEIPLGRDNPDAQNFLSLVLKSLHKVSSRIYAAGKGAPDIVFCVLSSPWHVSQTRVIKLSKNIPFVFTTRMADELIRKEIRLFEDENFAKYMQAGHSVEPIELKNIKTLLNGYEAVEPLGQKVKELEMTIFISISPEEILKKVEQTVMRHFHPKEMKFSSFSMASFVVVRDVYSHSGDFLLVDIGGEISNISMVKKSILKESVSFPLGHNFITRGVASNLKCSLSEAESFISLFQSGHMEESLSAKFEPVAKDLKTLWLSKFQASLAGLSSDISIPSTIYITMEKNFKSFFAQAVETEQFTQYSLTESKFKTIFLTSDIFHGMAAFGDSAVHDSRLIIDTVYISRILK